MIIKNCTNNKTEIESFINHIGKNKDSFRYFENRTLDCINNHLFTFLLYLEDINYPIGYTHIDRENYINWFGICISEGYQGQGYGRLLMNKIIEEYDIKYKHPLYLTVDTNNNSAIKLYSSFNFSVIDTTQTYIMMQRLK